VCDFFKKSERDLSYVGVNDMTNYIRNLRNIEQGFMSIIMAHDLHATILHKTDDIANDIVRVANNLRNLRMVEHDIKAREVVTRSGRTMMRPRTIRNFYFTAFDQDETREIKWDIYETRQTLLYLAQKYLELCEKWSRTSNDAVCIRKTGEIINAQAEVRSWNYPWDRNQAEDQTMLLTCGPALVIINNVRWLVRTAKPIYELEAFFIKHQLMCTFMPEEIDRAIPTGDVSTMEELQIIFDNYYRKYEEEEYEEE